MVLGKEYILKWVDDLETEFFVIFKGMDKGFLIFQNIKDKSIVVARPSSIVVREK